MEANSETTATDRPDVGLASLPAPMFPWTPSPLTWGAAVCDGCHRPFDYIKQDRRPVPVKCNRCDP